VDQSAKAVPAASDRSSSRTPSANVFTLLK
jgi:hypothetical protein